MYEKKLRSRGKNDIIKIEERQITEKKVRTNSVFSGQHERASSLDTERGKFCW
jgi:hypothetical protein